MGGEAGRRGWEARLGGEAGRQGWEARLGGEAGRRGWEARLGGEAGGRGWEARLGGEAGRRGWGVWRLQGGAFFEPQSHARSQRNQEDYKVSAEKRRVARMRC